MPQNVTDVSTFTTPIVAVADGDAATGADFLTATQGLANRTKYLSDNKLQVDSNGTLQLQYAVGANTEAIEATGGATSTVSTVAGTGIHGTGGAGSASGTTGGAGVVGSGGTSTSSGGIGGAGVMGYGAPGATSANHGPGVVGTGVHQSTGVVGIGGSTSGTGVSGTGGATNGTGVVGQGTGTGAGVQGTGGTGGAAGVVGIGAGGSPGVTGQGDTGAAGVTGTSGSSGTAGVYGAGASGVPGVAGLGGAGAVGITGTGGSAHAGVQGLGGSGAPGISSFAGSGSAISLQTDGPIAVGGTTPAHGTAPLAHTLYDNLIPVAAGVIATNGSGGFTIQAGFNFSTTISTTTLQVAFATAATGSAFCVLVATNGSACSPIYSSPTTSGFNIQVQNNAGGVVNFATSAVTVSFAVYSF